MTDLLPSEEEPEPVEIEKQPKYVPNFDDITWPMLSDVVTTPHLQSELENIILAANKELLFQASGIKPDATFLFTGPPGTGKTMSVKAVRNELFAENMNVFWMPYNIGEYGTAYINMGAVILQRVFDAGRKAAYNGKFVIYFFDEADVLLGRREGRSKSHKEDEKLLDTLMKNLQDISSYSHNQRVFFATNFEEGVDPAAIRAGRLDRRLHFDMPCEEGLQRAYQKFVSNANCKASYSLFDDIDYDAVARLSFARTFNYADAQTVIINSIRDRVYQYLRSTEIKLPRPISTCEILETVRRHHTGKELSSKIGF